MESGYRLAIVLTLVFDSLTTIFLGLLVFIVARARRNHGTSGVHGAHEGTSP